MPEKTDDGREAGRQPPESWSSSRPKRSLLGQSSGFSPDPHGPRGPHPDHDDDPCLYVDSPDPQVGEAGRGGVAVLRDVPQAGRGNRGAVRKGGTAAERPHLPS